MSFDESRRRRSRDCEKAIDVVTHERAMRDHVRGGRCAIHLFGDWVFKRSTSFAREGGNEDRLPSPWPRFRGAITIASRECSRCEATEEAARSIEPWFDAGYRSEEEILMAHVGNVALMNAGVADVDPVSILGPDVLGPDLLRCRWVERGRGESVWDQMCHECLSSSDVYRDVLPPQIVRMRVASSTFRIPGLMPSEEVVTVFGRCDRCDHAFAAVLRQAK